MAIELDNVDILTEVFYSALPQPIEVDYFLEVDDLLVYAVPSSGSPTLLTNETHYTVFDAGVESGGSLTVTALPSGVTPAKFLVVNKPDFKQPNQFASNTAFPAEAHEAQQDRVTLIAKYLESRVQRAIRTPGYEATSMELPSASERALKTIQFDSAGDVGTQDPADFIVGAQTLVEAELTTVELKAKDISALRNYVFQDSTVRSRLHVVDDSGTKKYRYDDLKFASKAAMKTFDLGTQLILGQRCQVEGEAEPFELTAGAPSEAAGDKQGMELTYAGNASYHWKRLSANVAKLTDFGASGNGVDDDKDVIKYAIETSSALGYRLIIPKGTYRISEEILPEVSGPLEIICDPGAEFIVDDYNQGINIRGAGLQGTAYALSTNASKGDTSLSVAVGAGANFDVGDIFYLKSEGLCDGPLTLRTAGAMKKGEWCEVRSVDGDTIELARPLYDSYATADSANCEIADFAQNIKISGLKMRGYWKGLQFHYCKGLTVVDAEMGIGTGYSTPGTISEGVSVNDCIDVVVDRIRVYANQDYTYGVTVNFTSQNISVLNLTATGCRHAFTTNDNGDYGQIRDLTVAFGRSYRSKLAGFDTHNRGENVLFLNCVADESGDDGFQIRCWKTRLVDCESRNSLNDGFSVEYPSSGYTSPSFVSFHGCRAINNGRVGFNEDDDIQVHWINCDALENAGGWSLKNGRIQGGRSIGNNDEAINYVGTTHGAVIDGLYAPADATQIKFVQGGDGFNVDLGNLVVTNCVATGYIGTRIWASDGVNDSSPPVAYGNIITEEENGALSLEGASSLILGQREVIPDGWLWAEDGEYNCKLRPSEISVRSSASYVPNLVYDAVNISVSTDFFSGPPLTGIADKGDAFVYHEGDAPIGGLTDEETYVVSEGSFLTSSNIRFTRQYSHGSIQTGFTVPAVGAEVTITNLGNTTSKVGEQVQIIVSGTTLKNYEITETTGGTSPGDIGAIVKLENLNDTPGRTVANDTVMYGASINLTGTPAGTYVFSPVSTDNKSPVQVSGISSRGFLVEGGVGETTDFVWRIRY